MLYVLTFSRRDLHHRQSEILDSVKRTGRAVRVRGRDGVCFLVTLETVSDSPYEQMVRDGTLIVTGVEQTRVAGLPKYGSDVDIAGLLDMMGEDH